MSASYELESDLKSSYKILLGDLSTVLQSKEADLFVKSAGFMLLSKLIEELKVNLQISEKESKRFEERLKIIIKYAPPYPTKIHKDILNFIKKYSQMDITVELIVDKVSIDIFYSSLSSLFDLNPSKRIKCIAIFSPEFFGAWEDDNIKLTNSECEKYIEMFDFITASRYIEGSVVFNEYCVKIKKYYSEKYKNLYMFLKKP